MTRTVKLRNPGQCFIPSLAGIDSRGALLSKHDLDNFTMDGHIGEQSLIPHLEKYDFNAAS